jgi:hypothetical protein
MTIPVAHLTTLYVPGGLLESWDPQREQLLQEIFLLEPREPRRPLAPLRVRNEEQRRVAAQFRRLMGHKHRVCELEREYRSQTWTASLRLKY